MINKLQFSVLKRLSLALVKWQRWQSQGSMGYSFMNSHKRVNRGAAIVCSRGDRRAEQKICAAPPPQRCFIKVRWASIIKTENLLNDENCVNNRFRLPANLWLGAQGNKPKRKKTYYFNPSLSLLLIKIIHYFSHSNRFPQFYYRVLFFIGQSST